MPTPNPAEYHLAMIEEFTSGEKSAAEFSLTFLDELKDEPAGMSEETYQSLQALFRACDAYCEDPELRTETKDGIGRDELLEAAFDAKTELEAQVDG